METLFVHAECRPTQSVYNTVVVCYKTARVAFISFINVRACCMSWCSGIDKVVSCSMGCW